MLSPYTRRTLEGQLLGASPGIYEVRRRPNRVGVVDVR
jgi:hypothetical protein